MSTLNIYRLRLFGLICLQIFISLLSLILLITSIVMFYLTYSAFFVEKGGHTPIATSLFFYLPVAILAGYIALSIWVSFSVLVMGQWYQLQLRKKEESLAQTTNKKVILLSEKVKSTKRYIRMVEMNVYFAVGTRRYLSPTEARKLPKRPKAWGLRGVTRPNPAYLRFSNKHPAAQVVGV